MVEFATIVIHLLVQFCFEFFPGLLKYSHIAWLYHPSITVSFETVRCRNVYDARITYYSRELATKLHQLFFNY